MRDDNRGDSEYHRKVRRDSRLLQNEGQGVSPRLTLRRRSHGVGPRLYALLSCSLAGVIAASACGGEDNADLFNGSGGTAARDASAGGKGAAAKSGSGGTPAGGSAGTPGAGGAAAGGNGSSGKGNGGQAGKGADDASAGKSGGGGMLGADASTRDSSAGGSLGSSGSSGPGGSAGALGSSGNAGAAGSAGAPDDSGPTGSNPGFVVCGAENCQVPNQVCCIGGLTGPAPGCFPAITGCVTFGVAIRCDERADCGGGGLRCCGDKSGNSYTTGCHNNSCADPSIAFCRTDQECSMGTTCKPIAGFEAYSACQN